jgi:glycosyltransferase involved in cell wall biosynthesis
VVEYILKNSAYRVKFFIAGDGYEKPAMKRRMQERNIEFTDSSQGDEPVVFTSWIQNIQNVLEGMDIVVLTSFNEGTPMSLIEAQLCGIPVIAVNVGGVKDTMIADETGFLINGHDLNQFGEALIRLIANKALRDAMGEKARKFASASFSKEKEIQNFRKLYLSYKQSNIASSL